MSEKTQTEAGTYAAHDLTAIRYKRRSLNMYPLLEQELQTLKQGYRSVHLTLFLKYVLEFLSPIFLLI